MTPSESAADDATLTSELEDTGERPSLDWSQLEFRRLLRPPALRRLAGIAVALIFLLWPERSDLVVARLIGAILLFYGATALWGHLRMRPWRWTRTLAAAAAVGSGVFLLTDPLDTATAVGRLVGALLVARGAWELLTARRSTRSALGFRVASGAALIAVGGFILVFPDTLLSVLTVTIACVWIALEVISLAVILDPGREGDEPLPDTLTLVRQWFADRPRTVENRERLYREVLYEGDRAQAKVIRFVMLMIFASIIASMGVVSDATAVVVGAMLIAPLMTPLMAMALSLVMGWPNRLGRSSLVALGGIVLAITVGLAIGLADFTFVDTLTNSQIVARSNPTVVDLVIAVAAGAAGAYALSRPDVSNSLPGVAIAIALVPPLTVAGISYSQSDWDSGNGALLLFLTNALAVLIVGGLMFLLLGVAPVSRVAANQHRVRTALAAVVGAAALIIGALLLNGTTVATNVFEQRAAQRVVDEWVEPFPGYVTIETDVEGDDVSVLLAGPVDTESPTADDLADDLTTELGREITVSLRIRLEIQETTSG